MVCLAGSSHANSNLDFNFCVEYVICVLAINVYTYEYT